MEHAFLADHRVLASVSRGYPRLAGSLITCYSPVRHATHLAAFTFDLHASSTPPTFVLSQDQTLHLKSSSDFFRRLPRQLASPGRLRRSPNTRNNLSRLAHLGKQPRSHAFFRGHPVCQRSPAPGSRPRARGGHGSAQHPVVKHSCRLFSASAQAC